MRNRQSRGTSKRERERDKSSGSRTRLFITRSVVRRSYPPTSCSLSSLWRNVPSSLTQPPPLSTDSDPLTLFLPRIRRAYVPRRSWLSESPLATTEGTRYGPAASPVSLSLLSGSVRSNRILSPCASNPSVTSLPSSSYSRLSLDSFLPCRITLRRARAHLPCFPSRYVYMANTCRYICSHVCTNVRVFSRIWGEISKTEKR